MQVTFWGTRGSIAKPGPGTVRYGGNTSCVEVGSSAGTLVVVDCGTGAHELGLDLLRRAGGAPIRGHLFIGHAHWDHIQGLPFFSPLFQPGNEWNIYGPSGAGSSLSEILAGQMEYRYFPVAIDQLASGVRYHDLVEGTLDLDDLTVSTRYLNHPALTLAYRFEADGASIVYASDHEPHEPGLAAGGDVGQNRHDDAHAAFAAGADLLVHDAQYRAAEYADRAGWGHSTFEYAVEVAHRADVGRLALFHHDPSRTDDRMDELVTAARAHAASIGYRGEVFAAKEGMRVELDPRTSPRRSTGPQVSAVLEPALAPELLSVVIVARTAEIASVLTQAAGPAGFEVTVEADLRAAFELVADQRPGAVLIEALDDDGGFDLVAAIRSLDGPYGNDVPVIMVGPSEARWRPDAIETGITEWLVWPSSSSYVRTKLQAWHLRRSARWQRAEPTADEDTRLAALHALGVLDTAAEDRFDRLTREIAEALDVPVALVSLVDRDRQWFKSRFGTEIVESPRDTSICAHAIHGGDILEVPDALADDRFADNPIVRGEPRIRFYAGMPLRLSDGSAVGTLCVVDHRPRQLNDAQLAELRRVGRMVTAELEAAEPATPRR
jgi:ribonuclease BN (tRNA processing enzyme)/CheY-like chemotaxis protein